MDLKRQLYISLITIGICIPVAIFIFVTYLFVGSYAKANIRVDAGRSLGPIQPLWKGIAQGGEQSGTRMLEPVVPQLHTLSPNYIRIDHIYDFYHVVTRQPDGSLAYDWSALDDTVCDIYATGAKPFMSLSYMPASLSRDGSVTSSPSNWDDWKMVVQHTIERYSGQSTVLCSGQVRGESLKDIYYEVWNEPDHEIFGAWSIYAADHNYLTLYDYAAHGALDAHNTQDFHFGGPGTTGLYKNWITALLDYTNTHNIRIDFVSWHMYSKDPQDYTKSILKLQEVLSASSIPQYRTLPMIISEWGYDPAYNPQNDTTTGAAHAVAAIHAMLDQHVNQAYIFEARDGTSPGLGLMTNDGVKKSRYEALRLLNILSGDRLAVDGETDSIKAIATRHDGTLSVLVANYNPTAQHGEQVPISLSGLEPGSYQVSVTNYGLPPIKLDTVDLHGGDFERYIYLPHGHIAVLQLTKQ